MTSTVNHKNVKPLSGLNMNMNILQLGKTSLIKIGYGVKFVGYNKNKNTLKIYLNIKTSEKFKGRESKLASLNTGIET